MARKCRKFKRPIRMELSLLRLHTLLALAASIQEQADPDPAQPRSQSMESEDQKCTDYFWLDSACSSLRWLHRHSTDRTDLFIGVLLARSRDGVHSHQDILRAGCRACFLASLEAFAMAQTIWQSKICVAHCMARWRRGVAGGFRQVCAHERPQ